MNNTHYLDKINKIKTILNTPGINQQQYIRALELLKKAETEYSNHLNYQQLNNQHQPSNQSQYIIPQQHTHISHQSTPTLKQPYNNVNSTSITIHHTSLTNTSSNPDIYKQNFESEELKQQQHFLEEQKRRQQHFLEEQQKRRSDYERKLQSLETDNINALDIMNLSPNYNIDELKASYKRLAIQHHPDRPTGNKDKFQLVTKCYLSLLERIKASQQSSKGHLDLKTDYTTYTSDTQPQSDRLRDQLMSIFTTRNNTKKSDKPINKHIDPASQSFNLGLFNNLYDKNKLWDPNDDGYEDWFRSGPDAEEEQPALFSDKFNLNIFNTTFETMKTKSNNSSALTKYHEPQELVCAQTPFTEIDNTNAIEDFSKPADAPGALQYTDLKKAFTGGCNLINVSEVDPRDEYKSVEDLQKSRDNISYNMSRQEREIYETKKKIKEQEERSRVLRLQQLDQIQAEHYRNTHQNMIGYASNPDY